MPKTTARNQTYAIRCPKCGGTDIDELSCLDCDLLHMVAGEPCPYCGGTGALYECCDCGELFLFLGDE